MADKTPVRVVFDSNNVATGLGEFQSGETVGTSFGGTGLASIGSAGQVLRVNAAGNGLEFANQGDVDVLASVDSAAVQVNDNLNISGALFVNDAISSNSTLTATALNLGDAEMSEADLEKLDGITNGTVAANKAVVVDGNKDAGSFRNITATGTVTTATLDVNSIESTDSTAVRINEGLDVVGTLQVNNIESLDSTQVIVNDIRVQNITANDSTAIQIDDATNFNGAVQVNSTITATGDIETSGSVIIGDASMNEADLEQLDGLTAGTITASKAVVVDSNKDISSFRNVTATGSFIIGSASMNESDLEKIDDITNGTAAGNKALVVDGSINIGTLGSVTATTFVIGSADIDETDLEKIDGITNGTIAANKAVVVDGNKDASSFRNITATGTITTATLDVNSIESTDSTNVRINEGLDVVGGLFLSEINSIDSSAIEVNEVTNFNANIVVKADVTTTGSFIIGSASINESELETIDGVTAGTVAASKAVVVDSNKDIGSFRNVTATGSFIIGSADMNETDLEKLDGITNGTVTASKAVVVDTDKDINGFRNITATGNIQIGGDLTVSGTTTSVNTTNLEIADALLELNKNNSGGADVDAGLLIQRGSAGNNAAFYFNEGVDRFKAVLTDSNATATAVTDSSFATINQGGLVFGSESVVVTSIKDEDNMSSNSATALATQQSIKAFVESVAGGTLSLGDNSSNAGSVDVNGDEALEFRAGNSITPTVAGNGVTLALNDDITVDQIGAKDSSGVSVTSPLQLSSTLQVAGTVTSNTTPTANNHLTTVSYVSDNFARSGFPNSTASSFPITDDSSATDFQEDSDGVGTATTLDAFGVSLITLFDNMEPIGSTATTDLGSSETHVGA